MLRTSGLSDQFLKSPFMYGHNGRLSRKVHVHAWLKVPWSIFFEKSWHRLHSNSRPRERDNNRPRYLQPTNTAPCTQRQRTIERTVEQDQGDQQPISFFFETRENSTFFNQQQYPVCSFGWWLVASADLFWENSTADWLRLICSERKVPLAGGW
jgi:hypothetical protein